VHANLEYGALPLQQGDLYLPQGVVRPPVAMVIHGGGWVEGSRTSSDGLAKELAARGIAAFNIDYRLADGTPETRWPAQLADAQLAVRWLRAHAGELGVNGARMAAIGDSAGAQLALMLGGWTTVVPGDQAGLWPDQPPNVGAVVDQFGPVDPANLPGWIVGLYPVLFGTDKPAPALLATMSPLPEITPHYPPVLIIQGDEDMTVPPSQSQKLQAVLKRNHVPVEMIRYDGDHAFGGITGDEVGALQHRAALWIAARLNSPAKPVTAAGPPRRLQPVKRPH
jgi:acetyl esterase/lipase